MKYAVVRSQGHQYLVSEGEEILVPYTKEVKIETLMVGGDKLDIGSPVLAGSPVSFKVVEEMVKGEKIDGFKYKAKSRYRKQWGHRAKYTKILIDSIKV